jgi:hypothetical protein
MRAKIGVFTDVSNTTHMVFCTSPEIGALPNGN